MIKLVFAFICGYLVVFGLIFICVEHLCNEENDVSVTIGFGILSSVWPIFILIIIVYFLYELIKYIIDKINKRKK